MRELTLEEISLVGGGACSDHGTEEACKYEGGESVPEGETGSGGFTIPEGPPGGIASNTAG